MEMPVTPELPHSAARWFLRSGPGSGICPPSHVGRFRRGRGYPVGHSARGALRYVTPLLRSGLSLDM